MRRPLVLVGFCYLLTLAAAAFFEGAAQALFWVCLAGLGISVLVPKLRRALVFPLAFGTAVCALGVFCIYCSRVVLPPQRLDGKTAEITGTVCELPQKQDGQESIIVRVDSVMLPGAPAGFRIRLTVRNGMEAGPYSRISGKVRFSLPSGGEGFTSRTYYASKGVLMFAHPEDLTGLSVQSPTEKPPYYYALRMRQKLIVSLQELLPEKESALICGILLGASGDLPGGVRSDFREAGVAHLLAVSGLHMSTIAALLLCLLLFLRIPEKTASAVTAAGIVCFMAVTCFVPSVVRSGIMCLLCLAAPILSRKADALNSLCLSALLICLWNPYAAADTGFLLSFTATLGIVLCAGPVSAWLNRRFDRVRFLSVPVRAFNAVLGTSLAASLFTMPVVLPAFGTLSLAAPLSNLLMLFPSALLLCFGAAAAILNLFLPQTFLAMPFALASGVLARYLEFCASRLARLPFSGAAFSENYSLLWLSAALVLFGAAYAFGKGWRLFLSAACLSAIVLFTGILSFQLTDRGIVRVTALDAGDGVCVVLREGGRAAVVGCGTYRSDEVSEYLRRTNAGKLDLLMLLTRDRSEFASAAELSGRCGPKLFVASGDSMADAFVRTAAEKSACSRKYASSADIRLWDGVRVEAAACGQVSAARITAKNLTILLIPKGARASALPAEWKNPDFIITDSASSAGDAAASCGTIFSMDRTSLGKSAPAVNRCRALWTGGNGNITLELKGDRTLSIRREQ